MIKTKFQIGELVRCSSRLPLRIKMDRGYYRRRIQSREKLFDDVGIIVEIETTESRWSHSESRYFEKAEYQIKFFQTGLTVFLSDIHIKKAKQQQMREMKIGDMIQLSKSTKRTGKNNAIGCWKTLYKGHLFHCIPLESSDYFGWFEGISGSVGIVLDIESVQHKTCTRKWVKVQFLCFDETFWIMEKMICVV